MQGRCGVIYHLPVDLFWLFIIEIVSVLIGLKLLSRFFKNSNLSALSQLLFSFGFGFGVLSYLVFLMSCFGLLYRAAFVVLLVVLLVFCRRQMNQFARLFKDSVEDLRFYSFPKFDILLLSIFLIVMFSNFLYNYTPPTQAREMEYNLTLPKLLLANHGIFGRINENNLTLYYPFLLEMIYALGMGLNSALIAKLIHYCFGILSALLVFELTKRFLSKAAALLAMTIFYTMPLVVSVSGTANVELGTLFYGLLAIYAILVWTEESSEKSKWLFLAGCMTGLSWQAKITGISLFPASVVFIFGWLIFVTRVSFAKSVKIIFLFSCFVAIGCSPWFLKNLLLKGNPLFPFPIDFLGWKGHEYAVLSIQSLVLMKNQYHFWDVVKMHNNIFMGDIMFGPGPFVFSFLLPALLLDRRRIVKIIFLLGFLFFLFHNVLFNSYFHRFADTRFYILFYTLCAIVAAVGIEKSRTVLKPAFVHAIVVFGLIFPCLSISMLFGPTKIPLFLDFKSEENYLKKKLQNYDLVQYANAHIPKEEHVLVLGNADAHSYYWEPLIVSAPLSLLREKDESQVLKSLKESKITHILFPRDFYLHKAGDAIFYDPTKGGFDLYWNVDELVKKYFREVYSTGNAILYRIDFPEDVKGYKFFGTVLA